MMCLPAPNATARLCTTLCATIISAVCTGEACGYRSPDIDYLATDIDTKGMKMNVAVDGKKSEYPLLNSTNINIYNALAAIATLREFGLSEEKIRNSMEKMGISETRYSEKEVNGQKVHSAPCKGAEPHCMLPCV